MLALATVAMMSKQEVPDQNETPELYQDYLDQQALQQPFLMGWNALIIFVLLAIIGIGVVLFIKAMKGGRSGGGGGF